DDAVERRHVDLGTERGIDHRDRALTDDVGTVAMEQRVLTHSEHDVEIARCAAANAGFAFVAKLEARAIVDAGRDFHLDFAHGASATRAAARRARALVDLALAIALAARLGDLE